jgi:nitrogenase-associated protein
MASIIFYEKTGCINNTKQKLMLIDAGHELEARDLLNEPWTKHRLRLFFTGLPVVDWFNPSAPGVKSGEIEPASLSEDEAIALMINDPILIRRPLLQVADEYRVGFDQNKIDSWIGLTAVDAKQDMETCPRTTGHSCSTN